MINEQNLLIGHRFDKEIMSDKYKFYFARKINIEM